MTLTIATIALAGCSHGPDSGGSDLGSSYAAELVELTNEARAAQGLAPLSESACAEQAGLERATALVGEDLAHAPLTSVIEDCAPEGRAAENLVRSAASPSEVVDAWMASPGHRSNIVDPNLTEIGIGCEETDDQMLCAQIFLDP